MILFLIIILLSAFFSAGYAQLSPGDLHNTHSHLEGIENCTQCHARGQKLDPGLCFKCHQMLHKRIKTGNGLHANADYKNCES